VGRGDVTGLPLRLGPIGGDAVRVSRSGLRWLCSDGHLCRPNEIVAYCNIAGRAPDGAFADEGFDFQVAFAPRVAGRIRRTGAASAGGYLDRIPHRAWDPDTVWATLEPVASVGSAAAEEPALLFLAGRRFADIAEDRTGLFSGWHDRTRAWWGDGGGATLLAPSTCDQSGLIRGDDGAYSAMFEQAQGSAQIVMTHSEVVIPCAAVLLQQLQRTPDEAAAIRADVTAQVLAGGEPLTPTDWFFVGALLSGVERSLLDERYDLLTREGLVRAPPAAAVCLSLVGEGHYMLQHRRFGYVLNMYAYRLAGVGPAVRNWLKREFQPYFHNIDDVARDYRLLVESQPGRAFVFVNRISSHPNESIQSYDALDEHTMAHTQGLRDQELNLMLHDLARAPNVGILDADAIAADLGIVQHLPDGVHATGAFQRELRGELFRHLRDLGVSGF